MADISHHGNTAVNVHLPESGLTHGFTLREVPGMAGPATDLHQHLRAWRRALGLTLEQVADAIGSKVNTLSNWELGKRAVDLDDLYRLADRYGVHPAALLFAPPETVDPKGAPDRGGTREGGPEFRRLRRAAKLVQRLPPAAADAWLDFAQQFAPDVAPEESHEGAQRRTPNGAEADVPRRAPAEGRGRTPDAVPGEVYGRNTVSPEAAGRLPQSKTGEVRLARGRHSDLISDRSGGGGSRPKPLDPPD